jgi:signal transduction histidine kinase
VAVKIKLKRLGKIRSPHYRIIVADSGPGVAPELTERIFEPFFTTKPPGRGTGLGLAIVARIVENFRGTVWVTHAREGGAAFHVLFPIVVPATPRLPAAPPSSTALAS